MKKIGNDRADANGAPARAFVSGSPTPHDRPSRVRAAIAAWKAQLIDLGGRNTLLYYKDQRVGTLDLTSADPVAIDALLAGRSIHLGTLFSDDARRGDAAKRARRIHAKAREYFEERGILTLFLGCGLATWTSDRSSSTPSAPVLLRAATLTPRGAAQDDFDLALSGEMEVNPTLLHLLSTEFGRTFDQEKLLDTIDGVIDTRWELSAAYKWLGDRADGIPGFGVANRIVLGNFSYAKLPMVKDLEASEDALVEHDIIAAIAGDPEARSTLNAQYAKTQVALDDPDRTPPSDEFLVLDADASQNYAINAVIHGQDLIVRGPPGTGKSQTIANLIATALARGQTVLFVAEKRAAIEAVFKRLKSASLADLILDLHGGAGKRRELAESLARSLSIVGAIPKVAHDAEYAELVRRRKTLNGYVEATHAPRAPWGISLFDARVQTVGIAPEARTPLRLSGPTLDAIDEPTFRRLRAEVQELADLGGFDPAIYNSRWAKASVDSSEAAITVFAAADRLRTESLPGMARAIQRAATETNLGVRPSPRDWSDAISKWRTASAALAILRPTIFSEDLEELLRSYRPASQGAVAASIARLFDGQYRRARSVIRAQLVDSATPDAIAHGALCDGAEAARAWVGDSAAGCVPSIPGDLPGLAAQLEQLEAEIASLEQIVGPLGGDAPSLAAIAATLEDLRSTRSILMKAPEIRRLQRSLNAAGIWPLIATMMSARLANDLVGPRLTYAWLQSIIERIEFSDVRVGAFDAGHHGRVVNEFRVLDEWHIGSTADRIRRLYAERVVSARDQYAQEAAAIAKQASLKRGHLPLRTLFAQAPHVLLTLKPCWAMSPLVVSQLLPSDRRYFDLVVFDEASQITPADAIPSILRGKRLVVAGDDRQLPPTAFFASQAADDETEEEQIEIDLAATKGFESILDSLRSLLRLRMLTWHYRSRDERLIAFSNAQFYDRSLTTFPGILADECLEHVLVPFRPGLVGQEKSAADEVDAVVRLIIAHAESRPTESLGVIAMGITHANRIDDALRLALKDRRDLDEFFAESREEPFFTKNLERVQGDERDSIILSVGYGKTPDGRLLYRFGPVNLEGGERRLNVAVTRAKRRMTVVSSFSAADMDPNRVSSRGAKLLRDYLVYAESRGSDLGNGPMDHPPLNPFEMEVRDHLVRAGVPLVAQLGASGYRIDFAAQHPKRPGQYVLAIECDGASYHSSSTARDRDRLRQEQLERLGWRFHRIWSGDWFSNREGAVARAVAAYQQAVADADGGRLNAPTTTHPVPAVDPKAPNTTHVNTPAAPTRGPRPPVRRGGLIDHYTPWQLAQLATWIESDTLLRTEDQLLDELMSELDFSRHGSKIVAALRRAIRESRAQRRTH